MLVGALSQLHLRSIGLIGGSILRGRYYACLYSARFLCVQMS